MKSSIVTSLCVLLVACAISRDSFSQQYSRKLCERIQDIRVLPFKDERGEDEIYNSIREAGDSAIPCLIDRISDTTIMPDPRQSPHYDQITVGDVAFFVLVGIAGEEENFANFLPNDIKMKYHEQGVYAYFQFVKAIDNRKMLQENVRQWYRNGCKFPNGASHEKPKAKDWPEIRIRSIWQDEPSGLNIANIEVESKSGTILEGLTEGESYEGFEVRWIDGEKNCLILGRPESDEEKEFCKED